MSDADFNRHYLVLSQEDIDRGLALPDEGDVTFHNHQTANGGHWHGVTMMKDHFEALASGGSWARTGKPWTMCLDGMGQRLEGGHEHEAVEIILCPE